jgi:hypothetical protein
MVDRAKSYEANSDLEMRFLVTPHTAEYMDRNSLWGLVRALRAAGHETFFPARPLDGFETASICRELGIDVLFQLNRGRPYDLPANIRHVAWFQDQPAVPADLADRVQPFDLVYRVVPRQEYEPDVRGRCFEGYLFLAMDEAMIHAYAPPAKKSVDFAYCGTMIPPLNTPRPHTPNWKRKVLNFYLLGVTGPFAKTPIGRWFWNAVRAASGERLPSAETSPAHLLSEMLTDRIKCAIVSVAEVLNEPLAGNWDPDRLVRKMREIVAPQLPPLTPEMAKSLTSLLNEYALAVPRLMERYVLVESVLHITNSVELYGVNWNLHPMFAPYHKGTVTGPQALFGVYGRARLNGANTLRSILHRRTLECMGIGEFIFINASAGDRDPGGLRNYFDPGVHYGEYKPDNIQEEAMRWIRDDNRRRAVGLQAAAAVKQKHLWRHRVEQILADLRAV